MGPGQVQQQDAERNSGAADAGFALLTKRSERDSKVGMQPISLSASLTSRIVGSKY